MRIIHGGAVRVIAGKFRSRPLRSLPGTELRPTSDRLRETLFNVLSAGDPSAFEGKVWLDLFAGMGSVGIEALSRGAAKVYFVEASPAAATQIQRNLDSLHITEGVELLRGDAHRVLGKLELRDVAASFIFLDPPYRMDKLYSQVLQTLSQSSLLAPGAIVVAEHDKKLDPGHNFSPLLRYRKLEQGDAALSFYRVVGADEADKIPTD